jgi:septal ring factor EnvC (AmiA/AmiB activator)
MSFLRNWFRGYGSFVLIHHGAGYFTLYAGLSRVLVAEGDAVEGGAPIGACDDMLHVEVLHDQEPLDPVSWLGAAR